MMHPPRHTPSFISQPGQIKYGTTLHTPKSINIDNTTRTSPNPDNHSRRSVHTPSKNFGLINFTDFDPDNFKQKGKE
jgi:hypothetical protein